MKHIFIGIVGPSGSGKTTLCKKLKLPNKNYEHIRLDNYFKHPRTFPLKHGFRNWEKPSNLKFNILLEHLKALQGGKIVYTKSFPKKAGAKPKPITLKLLYKHLIKGGFLIIVVPNGNNPLGLIERYGDLQHTNCFTEQSLKDLVNISEIKNYKLEIRGYEIPPYDLLNIIRIFFQKTLHFILLLIMIINGGIYFKTMTPNIMLVIKKSCV